MVTRTRLWTPARVAGTVVVLSLVAAFGVSSCNSTGDQPVPPTARSTPAAAPARNAPAPIAFLPANIRDVELQAVTGSPIKLSNYSGKVLVVNLWATWCPPCRREIPELVKLYQEFRPKGLEVVGLTTDADDTKEKVQKFIQEFNINYRIGWATRDVAITLMADRDSIPQSFVIGRDGRVVKRFVGFNPNSTPVLMKEAIESALNETAD